MKVTEQTIRDMLQEHPEVRGVDYGGWVECRAIIEDPSWGNDPLWESDLLFLEFVSGPSGRTCSWLDVIPGHAEVCVMKGEES